MKLPSSVLSMLLLACSSESGTGAPASTLDVDCDGMGEPFGCLERFERPLFRETVAVNTHYGQPRQALQIEAFEGIAETGARFVRNDLDWASVETAVGLFDFAAPGFDDVVAAAEDRDLRMIFILDYGNSLHGPTQAVVDDSGRAAFAAYARAAVQRFGGRGHAWEIWNEPNLPQFWSSNSGGPNAADYAALVRAAVPAIRAVDPDATIAVGALLTLPLLTAIGGVAADEFLQIMIDQGGLDDVDALTIHLYRSEPPETASEDIEAIRRLLDDNGLSVPVWSGEWGYSTYDPAAAPTGINYLPAVTPEGQASFVARMLLHNYSLGLERSVVFKDRDDVAPEPGDIEHHFGLMNGDFTPKPAHRAVEVLSDLVGVGRGVGRLALGDGRHGLVFDDDGARVVAVWVEHTTTFGLEAEGPVRVVSRGGEDVTPEGVDETGGSLGLTPEDGPLFLLGPVRITSAD